MAQKTGQVASLFSKAGPERALRPIQAPPDADPPQTDQPQGDLRAAPISRDQAPAPAAVPPSAPGAAPVAAPELTVQPDSTGSPAPAVEAAEPAKAEPTARRRRAKKKPGADAAAPPAPAAPAQPGADLVKVSFKIPETARAALREQRKKTQAAFTDIILDAIAINLDDVKAMLAAARPTQRDGGLFSRTYTQRSVSTSEVDEVRPQVNIWLHPDDLATLEQLVAESGARDRSHFVSTALKIHLKLS